MGFENNPAPEYNKKSVGGVQMSGLMKVRTNSKNAAAQIHGGGPTTKSYSQPAAPDNNSFDRTRSQQAVQPSMKGLAPVGKHDIIKPANRSNYNSVGDCDM